MVALSSQGECGEHSEPVHSYCKSALSYRRQCQRSVASIPSGARSWFVGALVLWEASKPMGLDRSWLLVADDFDTGRALRLVYRSVRAFPSGPGRPLSSGRFPSFDAAIRDYHRRRHAGSTVWSRRKFRLLLCMDSPGMARLVPVCYSTV